jgi:hypothetical protein
MIALVLALVAQVAQVDAGVEVLDDLRMVAVPTIAWIPEEKLVVVHHRKGVCPTTFMDACGPGHFDQDVHTLRAVSLTSGKERWRNRTHPLLHGELRDGDRVVALITSDVAASSFAVLDPASGRALSTCHVDNEGGASVRFRSRHVDASGAFFVQRDFLKNGGAPPPEMPSLIVRATTGMCTVVEGRATGALSWPNEDDRVRYGGTGARGRA